MASIVFATARRLGSFDLITGRTTFFGPVNTSDDPGADITDVAGLEDGRIFFSTARRLYEFDPGSGLTTQLGPHGRSGSLVALGRDADGDLLAGFNNETELATLDPQFDPIADQSFIRFMPTFFAGDVEAEGNFFAVAPAGVDNREIAFFDASASTALVQRETGDEIIVGLASIGGQNMIGLGDDGQVFSLGALATELDPLDRLEGLNGEQLIGAGYVGPQHNSLFRVAAGSATAEAIDFKDGDDTVIGSEEIDRILGGDGVDFIFGGPGGDFLDGGRGGDFIEGGAGVDVLTGGDGRDRVFGQNARDVIDGGKGGDEIEGGGGADEIKGGGGADLILGDGGRDVLEGQGGGDVLDGGKGNDQIKGGGGNDDLIGGAGRDVLDGGRGRDVLEGAAGRDQLVGGGGRDLFVMARGGGLDNVLDYNDRADQLSFGGVRFKDLTVRQKGEDLLILISKGQGALVQNLDAEDFNARDVVLLS